MFRGHDGRVSCWSSFEACIVVALSTVALRLEHRTLTDALDGRSNDSGDRIAYTFLGDGGEASNQITFAQLRRRALVVAQQLVNLNARGERALLLYPQGLDFIVAFFGCLY